jgi:spore germination cell wall hydrolase CwlJ-like protein
MALASRPVGSPRYRRPVRRRRPVIGPFVAVGLMTMAFVALTGRAEGPSTIAIASLGGPSLPASVALSQNAFAQGSVDQVDPIVTGSVHDLFASASFTGPNRSDKTDRFRPAVDILEMTEAFEQTRLRIASLRNPADETFGQSTVASTEDEPANDGPRISVAVVDPAQIAAGAGQAALNAIAGIAPANVANAPTPLAASQQLAYARANAPVSGGYTTSESLEASDRELWCLATAIYFEARGESYRGQVAVAQVVLNRMRDHRYPDTICGVVFQNQHRRNACQFSFACDGIADRVSERQPWAQAEEIARKVASGELYLTEVGTATHYHATYVRPPWARRMDRVTQIGLHVFYKFRAGWLFG